MTNGKKILIGSGIGVVLIGLSIGAYFELQRYLPAQAKSKNTNQAADKQAPQPTENAQGDKSAPVTPPSILSIRVGDAFNKEGYVENIKTTYSVNTPEIKVSAYIKNAFRKMDIDASIFFVASGEEIGPVTNLSPGDGDVISNFVFTKPTKGWPVGDYKIAVRIPTNEVVEMSFKVVK